MDAIIYLVAEALVWLGILTEWDTDCPECGGRMRRIRRKPPRAPYYMDHAHECKSCKLELEAGHILQKGSM